MIRVVFDARECPWPGFVSAQGFTRAAAGLGRPSASCRGAWDQARRTLTSHQRPPYRRRSARRSPTGLRGLAGQGDIPAATTAGWFGGRGMVGLVGVPGAAFVAGGAVRSDRKAVEGGGGVCSVRPRSWRPGRKSNARRSPAWCRRRQGGRCANRNRPVRPSRHRVSRGACAWIPRSTRGGGCDGGSDSPVGIWPGWVPGARQAHVGEQGTSSRR